MASSSVDVARQAPSLAIVVPCYNEEEVLQQSGAVLLDKLEVLKGRGLANQNSRVIFVDDGSEDHTWDIIRALHEERDYAEGIRLSHNRGHQNALFCGLMRSLERGFDATISIDADLQDDIDVMDDMLRKYLQGAEIVYGVRNNRDTDSSFKRLTARGYYHVMRGLGTEIIADSADFRLMSSVALRGLSEYGERNLFLRGIVPSLGFRTEKVYYRRKERLAGESKYPLRKMIALAIEGITSFSVKPLVMITTLGLISMLVAIAMLIYTIVSVAMGHAVAGWGSMMVSIWLVGGLLMISMGVTGGYVGKVYLEVKHRPRYLIEDELI